MTTTTSSKKTYNNTSPQLDRNTDIMSLSSPIEKSEKMIENVLILQGGGSLGAFGCGAFKAIANKKIKLDIIAGTSIGGVNAAIMAGSKDEKHPEQALEQFWLEISESLVDLDENSISSSDYLSKGIQELLRSSSGYYYNYDLPKDLSHQEKKENPSVTMDEKNRRKWWDSKRALKSEVT